MAHYIKEWRKHRKLTQVELAEKIGMARSYLSLIESGKRRYDQNFLENAAEILQCLPSDLIGRSPNDPEDIWGIVERLTLTERRQAAAMLRAMLDARV